jgi:hypothetical protein
MIWHHPIKNELGYEPNNCKWATNLEQSRNKRSNIYLTINGFSKIVADWADEVGVPRGTIYNRLKRGWKPKEAVFGIFS